MADLQVLSGPPSSDDIPSGAKGSMEAKLRELGKQNVAKAQSIGGNPQGPQPKGGGQLYGNNSGFTPSRGGNTGTSSGGGAGTSSPDSTPTPTQTPVTPTSPTSVPGSPTGGAYTDGGGHTHLPGDENMSPGLREDIRRMESQSKGQTEYDKIPGSDLRESENMNKQAPDIAKQDRDKAKLDKKNSKETSKIPGLDLRDKGKGKANIKTKLKNKSKSFIKQKKWKLLLEGGGIGGALFLLLLILFLLGTLLIPHFISNVIGWQFVKVTRAAYEATTSVLDEQAAVAAEKGTAAETAADSKYKTDQTYQDEKNLTPAEMNKVEKNLGYGKDNAPFTENTDKNGKLISITAEEEDTVDGNKFVKTDISSGFNGQIENPPNLDNPTTNESIVTEATKVEGTENPYQGASAVMEEEDVPIIQDQLSTTRAGEDPNNYKDNKTQLQDEAQLTEDTYKAVDDQSAAGTSAISDVNNAAQDANTLEDQAINDPNKLLSIVKTFGNLPSSVIGRINNAFVQAALDRVVGAIGNFLNPASGQLIAFCIVFKGSEFNPPTAQAQSKEVQRNAVLTDAISDQQKRGSPHFSAGLAGAENWKIEGDSRAGGVTRSIPIERASGEKASNGVVGDTSNQMSTQGAALGNLSNSGNILSALGVPGSGALAGVLDTICPVLTNIWANLALGVGNLTVATLLAIFTGGAGTAAEATIEGGADAATIAAADVATQSLLERIGLSLSSKEALSAGLDVLKDFAKNAPVDFIKQAGLIAGATLLAKVYVISQMGILHGGTTTGIQNDNDVDNGNNQLTNAMVANAYGGRPLTNSEAMQVNQDSTKTLADFNASQSAYQRYLALSNPQSLASVLTDRVAVNLNYGFFSTVMADLGNIFNPASLIPQVLFGKMNGQANAATAIVDNQDYGNVQQGMSDSEYNLVHSAIGKAKGYNSPAENQYLLDQSSYAATIDQTYGPCFNDSIATLLGTDTNGTPDLVRNSNGDIDPTQGICSPLYLGPQNPTYGDLVFRYRLAKGYNTTISIFSKIANAT